MANELILPDSRLLDSNKGNIVVDWPMPSGKTIRLTVQPIYCFQCGKPNGYVPRDIMSFVSFMCQPCAEKYSHYASNWQTSDQDFWNVVASEMMDRFGHVLTQTELENLVIQGKLGSALEKLERESPYVVWRDQ